MAVLATGRVAQTPVLAWRCRAYAVRAMLDPFHAVQVLLAEAPHAQVCILCPVGSVLLCKYQPPIGKVEAHTGSCGIKKALQETAADLCTSVYVLGVCGGCEVVCISVCEWDGLTNQMGEGHLPRPST
jgi:hypothetical protein